MEVVDNDSDHDEVLDAAITYKIDGTYSSNSSKIGMHGSIKGFMQQMISSNAACTPGMHAWFYACILHSSYIIDLIKSW